MMLTLKLSKYFNELRIIKKFTRVWFVRDRSKNLFIFVIFRKGTVLELARNTGIKRATVHFNVENLIAKSLISQTKQNNKRLLTPEDPENLKFLISQRKVELDKLEKDLPSILNSVKKSFSDKQVGFNMQVKYFEGRDAIKAIYNDSLNSRIVRSYVNLEKISKTFPENMEKFMTVLEENPDMEMYEIVDDSLTAREWVKKFQKASKNYHYKIAPKTIKMSATDILIYDNKVGVVNLGDQVAGVVMENFEYYEVSKEIFDYLWNVL